MGILLVLSILPTLVIEKVIKPKVQVISIKVINTSISTLIETETGMLTETKIKTRTEKGTVVTVINPARRRNSATKRSIKRKRLKNWDCAGYLATGVSGPALATDFS